MMSISITRTCFHIRIILRGTDEFGRNNPYGVRIFKAILQVINSLKIKSVMITLVFINNRPNNNINK